MEEESLLSAGEIPVKSGIERWSSYEHVGRVGSVIPTAGTVVTVDEIRSAAGFHPYPPPTLPPLREPLLGSATEPLYPTEQVLGFIHGYRQDDLQRQVLDEVVIRELLIDHVGHRCCWGSRPARTWTIDSVEDCNVYVGTLETFVEERESVIQKEPFLGDETSASGKPKGPQVGLWELDLVNEFPMLFVPYAESRKVIPNSEAVDKCPDCNGRGDIVCSTCNTSQEPGFYKENQLSQCHACHGRGLIAHKDGSDTLCRNCNGTGKLRCPKCGSRGLIQCQTCQGSGSLLTRELAITRWKTLAARKVSAKSAAGSVPDEVFHRAEGVLLCNTQAHQCTPAYFADSYFLNQFSSQVINERPLVPPTSRVICERHIITVVPVTRVTMTHHGKAFSYYIIGTRREVYLKDTYPARFCWGLCPCFDWLRL